MRAGDERDLRERLCRVGVRLHEAGLVAGRSGNLSARLSPDRILVSPRGVRKDALRPADLVVVDLRASDDPARAPAPDAGRNRASTELPAHLACYRADPALGAVLHAHAPALIAAGLRGLDIGATLPEVEESTGPIVTVPFAPSGSAELADGVGKAAAAGASVMLLARHGVMATGPEPEAAFDRLELAELSARACLLARES